jgi:putative ABC transport system permease protein
MKLHSYIKTAGRSLYAAKQRTILALIGIIIGIGSVIAMVSIGTIVSAQALKQFKDMGTDILTISKDGRGGSEGRAAASFTLGDILAIPAACPDVLTVAPYVNQYVEMTHAGRKLDANPLVGVTSSFQEIGKLEVERGRFITDLDSYGRFCVIGGAVAQELMAAGASDVLGARIRVGDAVFTVAGVLKNVPGSGVIRQFYPEDAVFVHITTAMRLKERVEIDEVIARIRPDAIARNAQGQIERYFQKIPNSDIRVTSAEELIEGMQKQMRLFTLLLGAIGSISMIVGGVGIMNVMLVSVSERRKEIGICRALGASRGDIQNQFLVESLILSLIGGMAGIVLGILLAYVVAFFSGWEFMLSYPAVFLGVFVSSTVGMFFGFYPARQAARLDPIVALR